MNPFPLNPSMYPPLFGVVADLKIRVWTNQRSVFRSRDQSRPIRGQYYLDAGHGVEPREDHHEGDAHDRDVVVLDSSLLHD